MRNLGYELSMVYSKYRLSLERDVDVLSKYTHPSLSKSIVGFLRDSHRLLRSFPRRGEKSEGYEEVRDFLTALFRLWVVGVNSITRKDLKTVQSEYFGLMKRFISDSLPHLRHGDEKGYYSVKERFGEEFRRLLDKAARTPPLESLARLGNFTPDSFPSRSGEESELISYLFEEGLVETYSQTSVLDYRGVRSRVYVDYRGLLRSVARDSDAYRTLLSLWKEYAGLLLRKRLCYFQGKDCKNKYLGRVIFKLLKKDGYPGSIFCGKRGERFMEDLTEELKGEFINAGIRIVEVSSSGKVRSTEVKKNAARKKARKKEYHLLLDDNAFTRILFCSQPPSEKRYAP